MLLTRIDFDYAGRDPYTASVRPLRDCFCADCIDRRAWRRGQPALVRMLVADERLMPPMQSVSAIEAQKWDMRGVVETE